MVKSTQALNEHKIPLDPVDCVVLPALIPAIAHIPGPPYPGLHERQVYSGGAAGRCKIKQAGEHTRICSPAYRCSIRLMGYPDFVIFFSL
jgi:hypothetical protein